MHCYWMMNRIWLVNCLNWLIIWTWLLLLIICSVLSEVNYELLFSFQCLLQGGYFINLQVKHRASVSSISIQLQRWNWFISAEQTISFWYVELLPCNHLDSKALCTVLWTQCLLYPVTVPSRQFPRIAGKFGEGFNLAIWRPVTKSPN